MVPAQGSLDPNRLPPATAPPQYGPMAPANPPKSKRLRQDPPQTAGQQAASSSQHHQNRQHRSSTNNEQGVGQSLSQQSGGVAGDNASFHSLFTQSSILLSDKALQGICIKMNSLMSTVCSGKRARPSPCYSAAASKQGCESSCKSRRAKEVHPWSGPPGDANAAGG